MEKLITVDGTDYKVYSIKETLEIVLLATFANTKALVEIGMFAESCKERYIPRTKGVPSHDTIYHLKICVHLGMLKNNGIICKNKTSINKEKEICYRFEIYLNS